MKTYQCGGRKCTDEELDTLEAIRAGKKKVTDPNENPPAAGPSTSDVKSMCELFPGLCNQVKEMGGKVDELYADRHSHPEPDENLVEALVSADNDCPKCKSKVRNFVLPALAKRLGFDLSPAKAPEPVKQPEQAAEKPADQPVAVKEKPMEPAVKDTGFKDNGFIKD